MKTEAQQELAGLEKEIEELELRLTTLRHRRSKLLDTPGGQDLDKIIRMFARGDVQALVDQGINTRLYAPSRFGAINYYRATHGCGLRAAYEAVERILQKVGGS